MEGRRVTVQAEGTLVMDGLLEGPMPPGEPPRQQLRDWCRQAARLDLEFHLEIEGDRFSLLARNQPLAARNLGCCPSERLAELIGELLEVLPPQRRGQVFSTLRTRQWRPGQEIQTVFAIAPGGVVEIVERVMPAQTSCPIRLRGRNRRRTIILSAAVAAMVLAALAAMTVAHPSLWRDVLQRGLPSAAADVAVQPGAFEPYLSAASVEVSPRSGRIIIRLRPTERFPVSAGDHEALLADAETLDQRLAIEALARGYLRCELFDGDGAFVISREIRVAALRNEAMLEVVLPLPAGHRVKTVTLAP